MIESAKRGQNEVHKSSNPMSRQGLENHATLRRSDFRLLCLCLLVLTFSGLGSRPAIGKTKEPQPIPVIDAEAGPCSAEMSVTDLSAKPVARATIRVHISHGFFGMRKTDLEIGTNAEGKAKFIGLPDDADEILYFHALKGRRVGMSGYSPSLDCHAKRFIVLHKPK